MAANDGQASRRLLGAGLPRLNVPYNCAGDRRVEYSACSRRNFVVGEPPACGGGFVFGHEPQNKLAIGYVWKRRHCCASLVGQGTGSARR